MLKAKEMIIDFINYAFLLILISFFLFYFLVGDRFLIFGRILRLTLPLFLFASFFLFFLKNRRNLLMNLKKEGVLNEIITYITPADLIKDRFVILFMSISVILISYFSHGFSWFDFILSWVAFFYMFFWRKILFRRSDERTDLIIIKNIDLIKDRLVISFLPLLMGIFSLISLSQDIITIILQGLVSLLILEVWHKILFKQKN